jgi:hypothetical protein
MDHKTQSKQKETPMPMVFKSNSPLAYAEMFDGRLQRFGVYERIGALTTVGHRSLTDGRNSIWIDAGHDGFVAKVTVWGTNDPKRIFAAISETFGVDIAPESEDSDERWKTKFDDKLYAAISDRLQEEPCRTVANQISAADDVWDVLFKVRLLIGLELAQEDATLMQSGKRSELLTRINVVYESIERAFSEDLHYAGEIAYMDFMSRGRLKAEEDRNQGPIDNAFLFQVNDDGTIVAVERPDIVAHRLAEREVEDLPF